MIKAKKMAGNFIFHFCFGGFVLFIKFLMDSPPLSPLGFEFDSDEEIDDILTQMQDEG